MAKVNVSLPQGTRDFNAGVVSKRRYIIETIQSVLELYGFEPLETPAMENLDTLMGKYGEEGDKLIFRVLDSGNPFSNEFFKGLIQYLIGFRNQIVNTNPEITHFQSFDFLENLINHPTVIDSLSKQLVNDKEIARKYLPNFKSDISSKALKYDLTIPFARYVAMNHAQLTMPFKRYQVQPVWRADRPQKGRYREFYQFDADVVGSASLLNEVELALIYSTVFEKLGISIELKINSRKILAALAEICGGADNITNITVAIDKLDKIGIEKVKEELQQRGLKAAQINIIESYLNISGSNEQKLSAIKQLLGDNESGKKGIDEIETVLNSQASTAQSPLSIDFTLARGLNYYTGIIFEVKATNVQMGSIGGGGRYDDLTGLFGVPNIPGVGISFGIDRIYDVLEELQLFPSTVNKGTQVLFFNLGDAESKEAFAQMQQLRKNGIRCELYPEKVKMDKQFKYAEKKLIGYVIIIGTNELQTATCNIKNIVTGTQQTIPLSELPAFAF
jgi:histidyl-tRNA synthetase